MAEEAPILRHVIAALVTNEPGVLAQVAGMFAARGFNIDSLVVGRTENPQLSRMTIVVNGSDAVLEQVRKQLGKLVAVVKVVDYKEIDFVERDLMLVQVSTTGTVASDEGEGESSPADADPNAPGDVGGRRGEIVELANLFRAKVVDVSVDSLAIELAGSEAKIEAFIELIKPYGIIELARTGVIAMPRGHDSRRRTRTGRAARGQAPKTGPDVDPASLPPG